MILKAGQNSDRGTLEWTITPQDAANTKESMLQAVALSLDKIVQLRPTIDLTGASAPQEIARPHTVVYDLFYGTPNAFGSSPNKIHSYPRGEVSYGENLNNVVLSTTNGVYTVICENDNVAVIPGRRYRVIYSGSDNLAIGGSGFSVSDQWEAKIERTIDDGANWAEIHHWMVYKNLIGAGSRYPIPPRIVTYDPGASATVRWRVSMAKTVGANTVTSTVESRSGAAGHFLSTEDVGEAIP
jgi:hypothetical protein